jgi:hypothetical protein
MIAEIMLYSYGYLDARALARKLVQTYRCAWQQLPCVLSAHACVVDEQLSRQLF